MPCPQPQSIALPRSRRLSSSAPENCMLPGIAFGVIVKSRLLIAQPTPPSRTGQLPAARPPSRGLSVSGGCAHVHKDVHALRDFRTLTVAAPRLTMSRTRARHAVRVRLSESLSESVISAGSSKQDILVATGDSDDSDRPIGAGVAVT